MAYFADLSPYKYWREGYPNTVNIGWLDNVHEYPRGKSSDILVQELWNLCRAAPLMARGFHECELENCTAQGWRLRVFHARETLDLGGSEILAFGKNRIYAAPDLIFHYVTSHQYLPPKEFVEAVISGPHGGTEEYESRIEKVGLERWPKPVNLDLLRRRDPGELGRFWREYERVIEMDCRRANLDPSRSAEVARRVVAEVILKIEHFPGDITLFEWYEHIVERFVRDAKQRQGRDTGAGPANR